MTKKFKLIALMFLAVCTLVFWIVLQTTYKTKIVSLTSDSNSINPAYYFEALISIVPIVGGIFGLSTSMHWSGLKSKVGKGIYFISLGLIAWGVGQVIWTLYNFLSNNAIPYPSLADVGYLAAVPLWAYGVFQLSKATGITFAIKDSLGKQLLIIMPLIGIVVTYFLLVRFAHKGHLFVSTGDVTGVKATMAAVFDLAYQLSDAVIITFVATTVALSWKYLVGSRFRLPILFTFAGFVVEYLADFAFSYTTSHETFYNGSYADLLFATAMITISVGLALIDPTGVNKKVPISNQHAPEPPLVPMSPAPPQQGVR